MAGGGGFGAPVEREPARVHEDVRAGRVSVIEARDAYAVVIVETAGGLMLDGGATTAMRATRGD